MNNIQKALEILYNKAKFNNSITPECTYALYLEQLIESLYEIVEGAKKYCEDLDSPTYIKRKEILSKFNDKLGIEE
jgi:hypothetical protein